MAVVLPDATNCLKMVMHGLTQTHPYVNTWYAKYTGTKPDLTGLNAIATSMSNLYWTTFGPVLNIQTSHVQTEVIDLTDRLSPTGLDTGVHVGTKTGTVVSSVQIACCLSWKVNNRYRGGHPRMYLPAAVTGDISGGGAWVQTPLDAYNTAAASFRTGINGMTTAGLTFQFVAIRYYSQHQLLQTPIVNPIVSTIVHKRVDSMRRRLGKEPA